MRGQEYFGFDTKDFTAYIQDFIPGMQIFKNRDGIVLLIAKPFANAEDPNKKYLENAVFISTDKNTTDFYQLSTGGVAIENKKGYEYSSYGLINPHHKDEVRSKLYLDQGIAFVVTPSYEIPIDPTDTEKLEIWKDGKEYVGGKHAVFTPMERNDYSWLKAAQFHPIPEVRTKAYFLKKTDGTVLFVDMLKYNFSYETIRLFIGEADNPEVLREVKITNFERMRDGGTTYITTDEGTLYVPSKLLGDSVKTTWTRSNSVAREYLLESDPKLAQVTYTDGRPTIIESVEKVEQ